MRNKIITMALALTVSMSGIPFAGSVQADAFESEAIVTDAVDSQSQDTDLTAETDSEEATSHEAEVSEIDPQEASVETDGEEFSAETDVAVESETEDTVEATEDTEDSQFTAGDSETEVTLGTNGQKVKDTYGITTIYQVTGTGNVTEEVSGYIRKCHSLSAPVMIYFPSGSYTITDLLRIYDNLFIVAEADSSFSGVSVNMSGSYNMVSGGVWTNCPFRVAGKSSRVENCTIENAPENGISHGHGIGIYDSKTVTISNCKIIQNPECGISLFNGSHADVSGCAISNNGHNGIGVRQNASVTASKCVLDNNKNDGFGVADGSQATVTDSTVKRSGVAGLALSDGSSVSFKGCTITTSKSANITISNTKGNTKPSTVTLQGKNTISGSARSNGINVTGKGNTVIINGNTTISGNHNYGISVKASAVLKLTGAACISDHPSYGIIVDNASATIRNATIKNNKRCGIIVKNKSKISEISNNTITGNKQYGISLLNSTVSKVSKNKLSNPAAPAEINVSRCKTSVSNLAKVTVNKVTASSKKISGTAQKKASLTITGGNKTYKGKAAANGKYSVKISKQKKGKTLRLVVKDKNRNEAYTTTKVK